MAERPEDREDAANATRVSQVISKAEDLVVALDETVAELVEMLRRYAPQEGERAE